ncbi:hypothetical protein DL89DRAFT_260106 [Linderina pennispora]|uniref:Uncharacterized protein n=1 Tax=Linderina pennispora TaxID=61395 RepID=A0A1Y1VYW6_9FUNG|nr:uncharacterized protein DL89DRAFT_260106 [Linderina pennispora]ORX66457.1 hypothetical protein DL89DRAFT_260106 [Linderina pennispora]
MSFVSKQPFMYASHQDNLSSGMKRQRNGNPARYSVSLKSETGAVATTVHGDAAVSVGQISQWSEQLSSLVSNAQDYLSERTVTEATHIHPEYSAISPSLMLVESLSESSSNVTPATLSNPSDIPVIYVSDFPKEPSVSDKRKPRIPISQRLGPRISKPTNSRAYTADNLKRRRKHSVVCKSDFVHNIRRVYIYGLMKPPNISMRACLSNSYGVDPTGIIFSHYIAYQVTELFVHGQHTQRLTNGLSKLNSVLHLKGFKPLEPNVLPHYILSLAQLDAFPGIYKESIRATFGNPHMLRGTFERYAQEYMVEIGAVALDNTMAAPGRHIL